MSNESFDNRTLSQVLSGLPTEREALLLERLQAAHQETILLSASLKKQDAELAAVREELETERGHRRVDDERVEEFIQKLHEARNDNDAAIRAYSVALAVVTAERDALLEVTSPAGRFAIQMRDERDAVRAELAKVRAERDALVEACRAYIDDPDEDRVASFARLQRIVDGPGENTCPHGYRDRCDCHRCAAIEQARAEKPRGQ